MKTAVIAHVFYPEMWPELAECIRNIGGKRDVIVTYVDPSSVVAARRDFSEARFVECENRGFDVWPFIKALAELRPSDYDAIVKLHTKRDINLGFDCRFNGCDFNGPNWRNRLLAFCRTPDAWRRTCATLSRRGVGMVADADLIVRRRDVPRDDSKTAFDSAFSEMTSLGGLPLDRSRAQFVAGTMFAARPKPLEFLLKRGFEASQFAPSAHVNVDDMEYAHIVERLLGFAVQACGLRIEAFDRSLAWHRFRKWFSKRLKKTRRRGKAVFVEAGAS